MPDPIASTVASRVRRPDPHAGPPAVERAGWARQLWSVLPVSAAFAVFGVVVWLAYQDAGLGPPTGEPPLIRAAPDPVRLPPDDAEDTTLAAEQGTVGRLWSDADRADQPERLLPLPEEPMSPPVIEAPASAEQTPEPPAEVAGTPPADAPPLEAAGVDGESGGRAAAPPEARAADASEAAAAPPATDESLQQAEAALDRLLAEVTAMSEETEVSGATAGAPAAESGPSDDDRASAAQPAMQQENPAPPPAPATAATPTPTGPGEPAATPAPEQPTPAPLPQVRPAGAVAGAAEPPERSTETAALSEPQAPTSRPAAAADGGFRIQLAAVRGEADARRAWDLFMADLAPVLGDIEPIFERAETENGVFYRVQVGPFASQQAADSLCEQLKQRNASCFVIRR